MKHLTQAKYVNVIEKTEEYNLFKISPPPLHTHPNEKEKKKKNLFFFFILQEPDLYSILGFNFMQFEIVRCKPSI